MFAWLCLVCCLLVMLFSVLLCLSAITWLIVLWFVGYVFAFVFYLFILLICLIFVVLVLVWLFSFSWLLGMFLCDCWLLCLVIAHVCSYVSLLFVFGCLLCVWNLFVRFCFVCFVVLLCVLTLCLFALVVVVLLCVVCVVSFGCLFSYVVCLRFGWVCLVHVCVFAYWYLDSVVWFVSCCCALLLLVDLVCCLARFCVV